MKRRFLTVASAYALVKIAFAFTGLSCAAETPKREQLPTFTEGSTAYIRIKEYKAQPQEHAGIKGTETTVSFGQAVKLLQRTDGHQKMWLVMAEQVQAWLPAYLLAPNKAEIEFLRKNERIPATMTFFYKPKGDDDIKVHGRVRCIWGLCDFQGVSVPASDETMMNVALKGNAVVFDDTAVKHAWMHPIIFGKGTKTYKVKPACLYYCVDVDDTGKKSFDCIDLTTLTFEK